MVADKVGKRVFLELSDMRERFEEVIARVEDGESVALMRDGRVVAELSPGSEPEIDRKKAVAAVKRLREQMAEWRKTEPTGVTRDEILKWRHEGHRR